MVFCGGGSLKLSQQRVVLPLPTLCGVIQTQSDGGESRKSGLRWGKPREAVCAESGHLTHVVGGGGFLEEVPFELD